MREGSRETQRLEKLLEDAGIKLSAVVSDMLGKSGRAMLEALITGERDPRVLAEIALGRLRSKHLALAEALTGHFGSHHAFLARTTLDRIDAVTPTEARLNELWVPETRLTSADLLRRRRRETGMIRRWRCG